jgi:hypothetical protein
MEKSEIRLLMRAASYFLGIALLFFGVLCLGDTFQLALPSPVIFNTYVSGTTYIVCGAFICIATRLRYGGGLWFVFGVIFVSMALTATVALFEIYVRTKHLKNPDASNLRIGTLWVIGVFCLAMGHLRHRKMRESSPNKRLN